MKVEKRTAQAFASIAVLSLLLSGGVFAYSTRLSHISSLAAPLDASETEHDDKSSTAATSEHEDDNHQTTHEHESETESEEMEEVNEVEENDQDQHDIDEAKTSQQIPAVVEVSGSSSTITQIDQKFSVSSTRPSDNSLSVSIAGTNVTGPRVLLINFAKDSGGLSSLKTLRVALDGSKVGQASSLTQVLNGTSTSPSSFVVLLTSTGAQLLVFIPHFSAHVIDVLAPSASGVLAVQAPLLLAGVAAVAAISAVLFLRRKRFGAALAPSS